jgi:hypothetical protein
MHKTRGGQEIRERREMAFAFVLLAGVLVGLLASLMGAVIDDFVVATVVVLVPGAVIVAICWRRYLE